MTRGSGLPQFLWPPTSGRILTALRRVQSVGIHGAGSSVTSSTVMVSAHLPLRSSSHLHLILHPSIG